MFLCGKGRKRALAARFSVVQKIVDKSCRSCLRKEQETVSTILFNIPQQNVERRSYTELIFELISRILVAIAASVFKRSSIFRIEERTVVWFLLPN